MAAKRFFDGEEDQPNQKRIKTRPSFASVIKDVVVVNCLKNFCSSLEPMLRRVVSEEVEHGLRQCCMSKMTRLPSLKAIQRSPMTRLPSLRLAFVKKLCLPIFTGTKIVDVEGGSLQIMVVDGDMVPTCLSYPIKVEVVVVDGDFPHGDDKDAWTSADFSRNVVRERNGKRPLLAGDLNVTIRDGVCSVGDIEFTDNSSWIRSRRFRLAARVVAHHGQQPPEVVIGEAISDAFVVKDHRGELYKKNYPPALEDEVWRLEKIGKGGAFHRKLSNHGINTVQDFLKLNNIDSSKLKKILGIGMSEKMWEVTLKHAKTCVMGTKLYRYYVNNFSLILNPICQLIKADFAGQVYYEQTGYIESLIRDAYAKWNTLEELDGGTALLTQGEVMRPYNGKEELVRSSYVSEDSSLSSVMQVQNEYSHHQQWPLESVAGFYTTITNDSASKTTTTGITAFFSKDIPN